MTLTQAIKSNSYLKVRNCTDLADVNFALDELRKLDAKFGENSKMLMRLWTRFLNKKESLKSK